MATTQLSRPAKWYVPRNEIFTSYEGLNKYFPLGLPEDSARALGSKKAAGSDAPRAAGSVEKLVGAMDQKTARVTAKARVKAWATASESV